MQPKKFYFSIIILLDSVHKLKSKNHLVQDNKQYHRKVLLNSFHLIGHNLGFHPETQKLEATWMCSIINSTTGK